MHKLLVIIEGHIPTTDIIVRALKEMPRFDEIKVVTPNELCLKTFFSGEYQILFIRTCHPMWNMLIKFMKKNNTSFVYYLDDNFWELTGNSPIAQCYQDKQIIQTLNQFVSLAHEVITGSENLAAYIRSRYNTSAKYIHASFDFSLLNGVSQTPKNALCPSNSEPVKIIYSGSYYRDHDFKFIISALEKLLTEYQDKIRMYFYGFVPPALKSFHNVIFDEKFYNYSSYIVKQYTENFDIGLAPLLNSLSNQAKSNLKYREYSACHIAGVYSNLAPYQNCITHGQNGLLAHENELEWYAALKSLIEDKSLRNKIIANANADVKNNYSIKAVAPVWQTVFSHLPPNSKIKNTTILQYKHSLFRLFIKFIYLTKRTRTYLRHHGFLFTMQKIYGVMFGRVDA